MASTIKQIDHSRGYNIRLAVTLVVFSAFFIWVGHTAYSLMILKNNQFLELAADQQAKEITISPKRGDIVSADGKAMAISVEVPSFFAHPNKIKDKDETARILTPILDAKLPEVKEMLSRENKFVWLKRRMPVEAADKFNAQKKEIRKAALKAVKKKQPIPLDPLEGIEMVMETERSYPYKTLAAHVLGGMGNDKPHGGVELYSDEHLKGTPIRLLSVVDARQKPLFLDGYITRADTEGYSVKLTIDSVVQYVAETELASAVKEYEALRGTAIVQNPKTGEILALASYPTYDPNQYGSAATEERYNMANNFVYEPGSTFKIFVMSGAIEEKLVTPNTIINCENGNFHIAGKTIKDVHPHGELTATELIQKSSNIGMAKLGLMLQKEKLMSYLRAFGFGQKSDIELPGKESGLLRKPETMKDIELVTTSFGQGVSITPIQLVSAVSAIANHGVLMRPYLIKEVYDAEQNVILKSEPKGMRRVISPESAKSITDMMVTVTESGGTAQRASIPGIRVAGKTGTAQKVDPQTRRYSPDYFVSSFVAFMPADDPALTVLVVIDEAKKASYGGVVAAPAVRNIAVATLKQMGILNSEMQNELPVTKTALQKGAVTVWNQMKEESETTRNSESFEEIQEDLLNQPGEGIPSFSGLTLAQALERAEQANLLIKVKGSGIVKSQAPQAGAPTAGVQVVELTLGEVK